MVADLSWYSLGLLAWATIFNYFYCYVIKYEMFAYEDFDMLNKGFRRYHINSV